MAILLGPESDIVLVLERNSFPVLVEYLEDNPDFDVNAQYEVLDETIGNLLVISMALAGEEVCEDLVRYADELGLIINTKNENETDALWYAVQWGQMSLVEMLLKTHKFDVNQVDAKYSESLFHFALESEYSNEDCVRMATLLLDYGCRPAAEELELYNIRASLCPGLYQGERALDE